MVLAESVAGSPESVRRQSVLRARWLGTVPYVEAWDLQQQLFAGTSDHLLLLEHPPTYTKGVRTDPANLLVHPQEVGAELFDVNRGGDITFHGPGQLVGYPIVSVQGKRGGGMADTAAYVQAVEEIVIQSLADLGVEATRISDCPGVWVEHGGHPIRKVAAVGVRLSRGRSMHGFAINVSTDMTWFEHIVPCGIADKGVTSLAELGISATISEVAKLVASHAARLLPIQSEGLDFSAITMPERGDRDLSAFSRGEGAGEFIKPKPQPKRQPKTEQQSQSKGHPDSGVPVRLRGRLSEAGVEGGLDASTRKPEWMRVKLQTGPEYNRLKKITRDLGLVTVCEEAGCPNIFDCWNEGTATFMLLGERCTRACGFCLVDTQKPLAPDAEEPQRIAKAVAELGLDFAVLTMVARDDLEDGGAEVVARTVRAIHAETPGTGVEVLISDLKGSAESLRVVCESQPTIVNHNIETVVRLQRAVRPSAAYSRSLTLLARAKQWGHTTKSGMIVGMGETFDEVVSTMADLAAVGVDIVTVGQYLRPTTNHLPIQRWWEPTEFDELRRIGESELGIAHVEASPLTRSSHHAGSAASDFR